MEMFNPVLVHEYLTLSARRFPAKEALVCGEERWTYGALDEASGRLAGALVRMGLSRQDRVAIFLDNSAEAVVSLYGTLKAGGIFVILNASLRPGKLGYILQDSGARFLIASGKNAGIVKAALSQLSHPPGLIWVKGTPDDLAGFPAGSDSWNAVLDSSTPEKGPGHACLECDLAALIYTSGSTGEPKGVMSTHRNMVSAARSIIQYLENSPEDILIDVLPLSFDYGLYQVIMAFMFGGTVVLEKSFLYPVIILKTMERERVTGFPIVPTLAAMLLKIGNLSAYDLGSLRYMTNTAAALPVEHIRRLRALFPRVRLYSMYGLTECKRVSYLPPEELDRRPSSVGKAIPNCEVFIVDEEGRRAAPGRAGELVIRGPNVMQGYWNAPELTARTFRPGRYPDDRMLYSGDLFRMDADGFLYFLGRKDDMIKTKGERVSPREIENALCGMEGVAEAAVIGVPDEIFGEAVEAFVALKPGFQATEKSVLRHCAGQLEPFLVPRRVQILPELPRSPNGKVDKKALRAL
jgi:long-chain acyl-CoA synthetase